MTIPESILEARGQLCGRQAGIDKVIIHDNLRFMTWSVTFFSEKVKEETLAFPDGILADFLHIAEIIEKFGPDIGKPYTAPMGAGLFEIRARGKEGIGRSLFCTIKGREIVILNSFVKKAQKTPGKEIDKARKRLKELKNG